jgi:hypothetical protein
MLDPKTFLRLPHNFKNKFDIYPPSLKEVIQNEEFGMYQKVFTLSQEEIEDEFVERGAEMDKIPTPYEYAFASCYNSKEFLEIFKKAFKFFTKEEITPIFKVGIFIIGNLEEQLTKVKTAEDLVKFGEEDYFDFQNEIRKIIGMSIVEPPNPNEHPKIRAMKAKARYRDKIKAKQGGGLDLTSMMAAICCMGLGLNPLNIGDISYASASILINQYQNKEKYQLDIDSLLAGADSKKVKPKYWIQQLD